MPMASAHTALDVTHPADGSVRTQRVGEIDVSFTTPVIQLGPGIMVFGPNGELGLSFAATEGGLVWQAEPSKPLGDGRYVVAWTVAAHDGHPVTGESTFTVESTGGRDGAEPDSSATTASPLVERQDPMTSTGDRDSTGKRAPGTAPREVTAVSAGGASGFAAVVARLGGTASLWGALVAGGALVFAATVLRGSDREDLPAVMAVTRWAAMLIPIGLVLRVAARSVLIAQGDVSAAWSLSAVGDSLALQTRLAFGLQGLGALVVLVGLRPASRTSWLGLIGVATIGIGHVVDGHSNTAEPRWLVLLADVTHLIAAAIWVGGVVMIGVLLRYRRRQGRPQHAALMGSRFSVIAGACVVLVGLTGVGLTWTNLASPSQLWQSSWGLFLITKVVVVAIVGSVGAYNHFRVVPTLEAGLKQGSEGPVESHLLRRLTAHETGLMVVIVLLTAWLVDASTSV
ncbi:MAG: CopD family protein [Ornithinimicrobium sp.]